MNNAYKLALAARGMREIPGSKHNPEVVQMFADVGHDWVKDDETAWCAAFVGAMLKRAGMAHTGKLNARSYAEWGEHVDLNDAQPGDIIVFWRGSPDSWKGHVGFFVRWEGDSALVVGGNQSNAVNISTYPKSRVLAVRRSPHAKAPSPAASVASRGRASPTQSSTIQAAGGSVVGAATAAGTAIGQLDGTAQIVVLAAAAVIALAALWIIRERLKKWAMGVK